MTVGNINASYKAFVLTHPIHQRWNESMQNVSKTGSNTRLFVHAMVSVVRLRTKMKERVEEEILKVKKRQNDINSVWWSSFGNCWLSKYDRLCSMFNVFQNMDHWSCTKTDRLLIEIEFLIILLFTFVHVKLLHIYQKELKLSLTMSILNYIDEVIAATSSNVV